jgi:hypothetical protein
MGILEKFTTEQLAAFSKEQLIMIVQASDSSQTTSTVSSKHTLLQEPHRLTSSNWLEFKIHFPALLAENNLWSPGTKIKQEDGSFQNIAGGPFATVSTYTLTKNIVDKHISKSILDYPSAADGWAHLLRSLDKKTVPAKFKALSELIAHQVNGSTNMPKALDRHMDIKTKLNTAFGSSISMDDLADFVFLMAVKDYEFQTNIHKSKDTFSFVDFKNDLETAFESMLLFMAYLNLLYCGMKKSIPRLLNKISLYQKLIHASIQKW